MSSPMRSVTDRPPDGLHNDPDPRVTLANERTFLAWTRTALALIAGGLVLSQLTRPSSVTIALVSSLSLICFGAVMAVVGYRHWQRNDAAPRLGRPLEPSSLPRFLTHGIGWFALAAAALAVLRVTS